MKLLMIGHLLGDFYFQTDSIVEKKKESLGYTALHCLIYSVTIAAVLFLATGKLGAYILPVAIIGVLHIVIDGTKAKIQKSCIKPAKWEFGIFVVDQMIHIVILWIVSRVCTIEINIGWISEGSEVIAICISEVLSIIAAGLLCGKPTAVIVSLVFDLIPKTIENAEKKKDENSRQEYNTQEGLKIGSWIGILEREIMLVLGLLGQYSAIGFVLTAKSLARHKQFDNPAFAEKYLIGTLLSALIALLSIIMCKML